MRLVEIEKKNGQKIDFKSAVKHTNTKCSQLVNQNMQKIYECADSPQFDVHRTILN